MVFCASKKLHFHLSKEKVSSCESNPVEAKLFSSIGALILPVLMQESGTIAITHSLTHTLTHRDVREDYAKCEIEDPWLSLKNIGRRETDPDCI